MYTLLFTLPESSSSRLSRRLLAAALLLMPLWAHAAGDASQSLTCAPPVQGELVLPPGMNIERMQMLKEGQFFKVYTEVESFDEKLPQGGALPPAVASQVDVSASGLNRMLQDVISRSRRFKVYDMKANVTAEHSDVMIKAKVIFANQTIKPGLEGGRRIASSRVVLSVQMVNMYTGESLLQSDVNVTGETGLVNNDRVVLTADESTDSPEVVRRLAEDFFNALQQAFAKANYRLEDLLRPIAMVSGVEGCEVNLFGGSRFGLQSNDDLVVFRVTTRKLGEVERIVKSKPVALIKCKGVGVDDSQCKVVKAVPGYKPEEDDFAIITDESLSRTRQF